MSSGHISKTINVAADARSPNGPRARNQIQRPPVNSLAQGEFWSLSLYSSVGVSLLRADDSEFLYCVREMPDLFGWSAVYMCSQGYGFLGLEGIRIHFRAIL